MRRGGAEKPRRDIAATSSRSSLRARLPAVAAFDLIIMLGTVSNLADPHAARTHCHRLLRVGGRLYFNLPLAGSWPARLYGSRFWMYSPSCCTFMSLAGCRSALTRSGFLLRRDTTDYQMPTLAKLVGHLKLRAVHPWLERLGLARLSLPVAWPVPGVQSILAEKVS